MIKIRALNRNKIEIRTFQVTWYDPNSIASVKTPGIEPIPLPSCEYAVFAITLSGSIGTDIAEGY